MAELELDKVIIVGEDSYNVNAVTADKVNRQLKINKLGKIGADGQPTPSEPVYFDGEYGQEVSVVTPDGGQFDGPIRVHNNTDAKFDDKAVLNYHDTVDVVFAELKNYSAMYSWNSEVQDADEQFKPVILGNAPNSISLVCGIEEQLQDFDSKNQYEHYLSVYLYLCTDTGNLYYGAAPVLGTYYEPRRLAFLADSLCFTDGSKEDPYTAASIKHLFDTIIAAIAQIKVSAGLDGDTVLKSQKLTGDQKDYTAADLLSLMDNLSAAITEIKESEALEGDVVKKAASLTSSDENITGDAILDAFERISNQLGLIWSQEATGLFGQVIKRDADVTKNAKDYTDSEIAKAKTYADNKAAEAKTYAENKDTALSDSITGGSIIAKKATCDGAGNTIVNNYYQSPFNTVAVNKIYIQTSDPPNNVTGYNKGDIWIKYTS